MFYGRLERQAAIAAKRFAAPARLSVKRKERRARVLNTAQVFFGDQQRKALVRNMSLNGLMLETTLPPARGERVMIKIIGLAPIWGETRWRYGGTAGIKFEGPITAEELQQCVQWTEIANDFMSDENDGELTGNRAG
jgi:hypothetical protein